MSEQMQPGRELDRLVAEAIGLPILDYDEHRGDHAWLNDPANYPYITNGAGEWLIFWVAPNTVGKTWSPSTNIDLAMKAWTWLEDNYPKTWGQIALMRDSNTNRPCVVRIEWEVQANVSEGDTYPHAISLAVIEAAKEAKGD